MRIAIVNDVGVTVEALRRVVTSVPEYQIAWIAADGEEAVRQCAVDVPDLILMDLMMPRMDGAEASRIIMRDSPCAILIVTANVGGNSSKVFEAMGWGALDVVSTPVLERTGEASRASDLLAKIAMLSKLIGKLPPRLPPVQVEHGSRQRPAVCFSADCHRGFDRRSCGTLARVLSCSNASNASCGHYDCAAR